jgi:mannose-6-phosphate isomerase-like protein (cupin superfamily)
MAKNENNKLYIPFQFQLQMSGYDLSVKYLEKLDETCVEFTHTHVNFEIYYILSGRMRMQIGGEERLLLPNHFILIPPGMRHGAVYEPDEPKEYVVFVYGVHRGSEPSALRRTPEYAFMEQVDQTIADRPFIIAEDRNGCAAVLSAIQNEAHGRQAGWQIILVDYCREYLIKLLRNVLTDGARAPSVGIPPGNLGVEITKCMHEHYPENISLERRREGFPHTPVHVTDLQRYFGRASADAQRLQAQLREELPLHHRQDGRGDRVARGDIGPADALPPLQGIRGHDDLRIPEIPPAGSKRLTIKPPPVLRRRLVS